MADLHRCGDSGGVTAEGAPCRRRVAGPGDLCPHHLEDAPVGRVVVVDGEHFVDSFGLAVRLGIADTPPAIAAEVYPGMQLVPGEERPDPGEVLDDVPVFAWIDPQEAARQVDVSPRHLLNLETKGLPARGTRATKRYALPHLIVWWIEYKFELDDQGSCRRLPFRRAWHRHRLRHAGDDLPPAA